MIRAAVAEVAPDTLALEGPLVGSLSGAQLRLLARVRSLRPDASLRWERGLDGWVCDVLARERRLATLTLSDDGRVGVSTALL
jgi:hypothetical protein